MQMDKSFQCSNLHKMLNNLITINQCDVKDLKEIISLGRGFKSGQKKEPLKNKTAVLLFDKPSLRTKLSFMIGIEKLGGNAIYFSPEEVGMGNREPIKDVSTVISKMADLSIIRTFGQKIIEEYLDASSIPVINALTNEQHPCQALADIMTITEHVGDIENKNIVFIGDGNNVARSLSYAVIKLGGNFKIASPKNYFLDPETVNLLNKNLSQNTLTQTSDIEHILEGADIVYTDVWTSMGQEKENNKRLLDFKGFQVTSRLLDKASNNVKFMHDLPAHPGEEIEEGLLYDKRSIVFDQSENRLWAQMGLIDYIFSSM